MGKKWKIFVDVLTALSVVAIIVNYIYPNLSSPQKTEIYAFDLFVVLILAVDFYNRYKKSELPLRKFLIKHWYELPSMLPLILFSAFEQETIIGPAVRSIRLLRLFRIIHLFFRTLTIFEGSRLMYIMVFAFTAILLGAIGEYMVESTVEGTKINTFGDALWWSIATVTTVGYGDVYPITAEGKVIASALMIIGIMVLGLFISTLGGALIESRFKKPKEELKQNTLQLEDNDIDKDKKQSGNWDNNKTINGETISLIKNKLDSLETLREDEFYMLIRLIKTIYYKEKIMERNVYKNQTKK
jgi:voltage-gated potassium channel